MSTDDEETQAQQDAYAAEQAAAAEQEAMERDHFQTEVERDMEQESW